MAMNKESPYQFDIHMAQFDDVADYVRKENLKKANGNAVDPEAEIARVTEVPNPNPNSMLLDVEISRVTCTGR